MSLGVSLAHRQRRFNLTVWASQVSHLPPIHPYGTQPPAMDSKKAPKLGRTLFEDIHHVLLLCLLRRIALRLQNLL